MADLPLQQSSQEVNLTEVAGVATSLGQKAVTASIPVVTAAQSSVVNGGKKVAVTNTAVQLITSSTPVSQVIITASSTNVNSVFMGNATVTADYHVATSGLELQPGGAVGLVIDDLNKVYINGTANDGVSWLGS